MDEFVRKETCEEREKRIEEWHETLLTIAGNLSNATSAIAQTAALQEEMAKSQRDHEDRIRALETKPAGRWNTLVTSIITAVGGGVAGAFLSKIIN